MINASILSFYRHNIPSSITLHIENMDGSPASKWQAYFAIRFAIRSGYIAYATHGLTKYRATYGANDEYSHHLGDLLDDATQYPSTDNLAA